MRVCVSRKKNKELKIEQAKTGHKQRFSDDLDKHYGIRPEITQFLSFIYNHKSIKKIKQLEGKKSDIQSSSSTWKIDHLERHIKTLDITFVNPYHRTLTEPTLQEYNVPDDLFSSIQQRYLELASVYLGVQMTQALELGQDVSFLKKLQHCNYYEVTTRIFIDALMTAVLRSHGVQVRVGEKLYDAKEDLTLPKSIADYVMYSRTGKILGAIETKNGGHLKAESVIQCMLQLMALPRKAPHSLFGIVTDGVRYVFILFTKDGAFEFERESAGQEGRSYDINTWEDLRQIVGVFNLLLQRRQR